MRAFLIAGLLLLRWCLTFSQILPQDLSTYVDSAGGFSFQLPQWFTTETFHPGIPANTIIYARESGMPSFSVSMIHFPAVDYEYDQYLGSLESDTTHDFVHAVSVAVFHRFELRVHGLIEYGRIDSLTEFDNPSNYRIVAAYCTPYDAEGWRADNEIHPPVFYIDFPGQNGNPILELYFEDFYAHDPKYKGLALQIVRSIRLKLRTGNN
jgi:hypothetical protein